MHGKHLYGHGPPVGRLRSEFTAEAACRGRAELDAVMVGVGRVTIFVTTVVSRTSYFGCEVTIVILSDTDVTLV